jgi:hypothetical protein
MPSQHRDHLRELYPNLQASCLNKVGIAAVLIGTQVISMTLFCEKMVNVGESGRTMVSTNVFKACAILGYVCG